MNDNDRAGSPGAEEDFAALFESTPQGTGRFDPGQVIEAEVVKITPEWILLNVGAKGEGFLEKREMLDDAGALLVKEGDKVRAYFLSGKNNELRFTTRLGSSPVGYSQLEVACREGIPVEGTIVREMKGGFEVKIRGCDRAFCPFSQMGLGREEDKAAFVGKSLVFKVTECKERNVVLSRREMVAAKRKERVEELRATLKEGLRVKGKVTSIQEFGAFVDIGGVEGLLPVSEIAWTRTEKVGDVLSVGQTLELSIKKLDWENGKFSFSRKDLLPDPWANAEKQWPLGSYHDGAVTKLAPFGAFVRLRDGVEGLLPISKLGMDRRIGHPREVLDQGQAVEVRIEAVDGKNRKISLSLGSVGRAREEDAATLKAYRAKASNASSGLATLGELLGQKLGLPENKKD
ncbi:MAG: 30S ribosomal protein S1 [Elusimicrobia bacterium]|nr:30S ribosomal protein S1 [Elusimicrobiota bacterium]